MNHLKPLVLMQLKDKLDFSFTKSKGKFISKVIFTVLGFVAVVVACFMLYYASTLFSLFSYLPIFPISAIVVLFTVVFILSCITCSFGLMKALYMSKDNPVLLTMPVKANVVFVSKLIVYYIYELLRNCFFLLPIILAYGIFSGFSWLFYPWLIISFFIISAIPVLIGAIISIPLMFICTFLKRHKTLGAILFTGLITGAIYLVVYVISLIPENFNLITSWGKIYWDIQEFLISFSETFKPLAYVVEMLCGQYYNLKWHLFSINTLYIMLALLGIILVLFTFVYFVSRPLFFKMASSPFEYKKKTITKTYKNKKRRLLKSSLNKEFKTSFRESKFIYNYGSVLIVLPISILLLNKIFNAMNTRLQGTYMIYAFNILIMLLLLLTSNSMIASIYSNDGRTAYLMKTVPHKHSKYLFPKLLLPILLASLSTAATIVIFGIFSKVSPINLILLFVGVFGLHVGHLLWSAELDLMNPQNEQYATTGEVSDNPNEKKSTILAFLISFIAFAVLLFFFMENAAYTWIKFAVIGLVFAIARTYFYFSKIKVYYLEK